MVIQQSRYSLLSLVFYNPKRSITSCSELCSGTIDCLHGDSEGFINISFELPLCFRGGNKVSTTYPLFCSQVGQRRRSVSTGTCDINQGPCRSQGHVEELSVLPPSILVFCHLSQPAQRGR